MTKLRKILETIAIFIIIMLVISFIFSLISFIKQDITLSQVRQKTGLYFLYTIGYGALDEDVSVQNILAMIGLIALALMSTYLTINLFWRIDDVKLSNKIILKDNMLNFEFTNSGRSICDVKASFVIYDPTYGENIGDPKEYTMPIIISKSKWNLKVSLNETFWYKSIYNLLSNKNGKLFCTYSFVDTKNGQSSIRVQEIVKENIIKNGKALQFSEFTEPVIISSKNLLPCEYGSKVRLSKEEGFINMHYEINKNADDKNFAMAYYDYKSNNLNLGKFDKEKTYLEFSVSSAKKLKLNFEIKFSGGSQVTKIYELDENMQTVNIPLSEVKADLNLENIIEICYTVFKEYNYLTNDLKISDFKIVQ